MYKIICVLFIFLCLPTFARKLSWELNVLYPDQRKVEIKVPGPKVLNFPFNIANHKCALSPVKLFGRGILCQDLKSGNHYGTKIFCESSKPDARGNLVIAPNNGKVVAYTIQYSCKWVK